MNATFSGAVSGIQSGDAITKIEIVWKLESETEAQAISAGRTVTWNAGADDAKIAAFQASGQIESVGNMSGTYTPAVRVTESRGGSGSYTGSWTNGDPTVIYDMQTEPSGILYYRGGQIDAYPSGNATVIDAYGRARFDFTGLQSGKSTTTIIYEFNGDNDCTLGPINGTGNPIARHQLILMKKAYTEAGAYPSVTDNPLFRFSVDIASDNTQLVYGSYRYCSTALGVTTTGSTVDKTHTFRATITLDHANLRMNMNLYNLTTSTNLYTTSWKTINLNTSEFSAASVMPGTAIFEGYQNGGGQSSATVPSYDSGNKGIKIIEKVEYPASTYPTHVQRFTSFKITQG